MPLPKRRRSKARQGNSQSHLRSALPSLNYCPQCHSPKLPHQVCPACGVYNGRKVIEIKSPKKRGS